MTNPGYKLTEIGEIPDDWDIKPFGELIDLRSSKGVPQTKDVYIIPMEYIPDNSTSCKFKKSVSGDVIPPTYCEPGDVLMPKITPSVENGKIGIVPELPNSSAFATSEVFPVVSGPLVDNLFIFYLLKFSPYRQALVNSMIGSTGRQRVPKSFLLSMNVCFPQLLEQQKIAEILSTADRKIELIDNEIQATEKLKKGLMQTLLTRGIGHTKFKKTEIGEIPEEWEIKKIKDCILPTFSVDPKLAFGQNQFSYVDVSAVSNEELKIIDSRNMKGSEAPSRARKEIKHNDILFATVRPYLKRVAIVPYELDGQICSTAFCVVRPDIEKMSSNYMFYSLTSDTFVQRVTGLQTGSAYPAISDGQVLSALISVPEIEEQQEIAGFLSIFDERLKHLRKMKNGSELLRNGLMQGLLTGRVRVKISKFKGAA